MRKPLVGRKVTCSLCAHSTVHGTTQVCRKVVFQFCSECWKHYRPECMKFMTAVTAYESPETVRPAA